MRKLAIAACLLAGSFHAFGDVTIKDTYTDLVDKKGNITLPQNYRQNWTFLGTYFVKGAGESMAEGGPTHDVHTVYTQPDAAAHYRKHGKFPDGTVLLKDVNGTKSEPLTTGLASYEDAPKVTFMMVKNTKGRFASNKAWAEGWGWALFNPGDPKSQTSNWQGEGFNNCFGCHVPVKNQDWVYTQGYKTVLGR
ncbi:cytochrome P460 family protein [Porticoccus sp. GXU_MW_L64]